MHSKADPQAHACCGHTNTFRNTGGIVVVFWGLCNKSPQTGCDLKQQNVILLGRPEVRNPGVGWVGSEGGQKRSPQGVLLLHVNDLGAEGNRDPAGSGETFTAPSGTAIGAVPYP